MFNVSSSVNECDRFSLSVCLSQSALCSSEDPSTVNECDGFCSSVCFQGGAQSALCSPEDPFTVDVFDVRPARLCFQGTRNKLSAALALLTLKEMTFFYCYDPNTTLLWPGKMTNQDLESCSEVIKTLLHWTFQRSCFKLFEHNH